VEACEIREKDFLVLMVSKPKPTPVTPAASSSAASPPVPAPEPAPEPAQPSQPPVVEPPSQPEPTPVQPAASSNDQLSSFLSGDALQTSIQNMVEMGFPRDQVQKALRASFNNPDRAVEYLMNGIPAHLESEMSVPQTPAPAAQPATGNTPAAPQPSTPSTQGASAAAPNVAQNLFQLAQQQQQQRHQAPAGLGAAAGAGAGGLPGLGTLPNPAQLQNLRQLLAQNPDMTQHLVQQISQSNPQLAQTLGQNPEALFQLLGEMEEFGDDTEGGLPPGAQVVNVTEEERAAIERLEALGFPRHAVIEAYFACDKNEELAANYLFESGFEDS